MRILLFNHNGKDSMKYLSTITLLSLSILVFGQEKTFEREYTYKASEIDSKLSSRAIAINQLRSMLLAEIGVYVESESILKTTEVSGKFNQDFAENIATLSTGITKLEVLDERWNGETFWMKAAITIDEKNLEESLKQLINDRQKTKQLEELKQQLKDATKELDRLKKELTTEKRASDPISEKLYSQKYNDEINKLVSVDYFYNANLKAENLDYYGAIADFTKAIEFDPFFNFAYHNRGLAKSKLQDLRGAIEDFDMSIEIDPKDIKSYNNRGNSKSKLQDNWGAIRDFTRAIEIDPNHASAYYNRAGSKRFLKDFSGSIADYTKTIELDSEFELAYVGRGVSKMALHDYRGAIADLTKAIALDPNSGDAYYFRGLSKSFESYQQKESGCLDLRKAGELGNSKAYDAIREFCN
jgi:tetratricopeptide (TPR) repeat protein